MYNFSFTTTRSPRGKKSKIYQVLNIKRGIIERLIKWMIIKIYKQEKKRFFIIATIFFVLMMNLKYYIFCASLVTYLQSFTQYTRDDTWKYQCIFNSFNHNPLMNSLTCSPHVFRIRLIISMYGGMNKWLYTLYFILSRVPEIPVCGLSGTQE